LSSRLACVNWHSRRLATRPCRDDACSNDDNRHDDRYDDRYDNRYDNSHDNPDNNGHNDDRVLAVMSLLAICWVESWVDWPQAIAANVLKPRVRSLTTLKRGSGLLPARAQPVSAPKALARLLARPAWVVAVLVLARRVTVLPGPVLVAAAVAVADAILLGKRRGVLVKRRL